MTTHTNLTLPINLEAALTRALASGFSAAALSSWRALDAQYGTNSDAPIDFAALFLVTPCHASPSAQLEKDFICKDSCCTSQTLTPRQAYAMHAAADSFLDLAFAVDDADSWLLPDLLPPACTANLHDPVWGIQLRHVFHLVAARLAAGLVPLPRCTAEEMALHVVLEAAKFAALSGLLAEREDYQSLDIHPGDFSGVAGLREWLFTDLDVLMLFESPLDSLEDSDLERLLAGTNLHPRRWFIPFRAEDATTADLVLPSATQQRVTRKRTLY